jgi:carbon storage regulator
MLVLKRKQGQAIDVGDDVRITLTEVRGAHVKIAISAPKGVRVKRSEVARQISVENKRAAQSTLVGHQNLDKIVNIRGKVGT